MLDGMQSQADRGEGRRHVVEIRTVTLKRGTRARFHGLFTDRSLPLLRRWRFDVVAFGPSLHDETSFYVVRSFASLAERQSAEDAFYGSDDWRQGPREEMLACIESYVDVVLELDEAAVEALRRSGGVCGRAAASAEDGQRG
ncbi:MAG: hypothetical protein ACJ79R_13085 [Anaeromyxobacteraceae bacterium]